MVHDHAGRLHIGVANGRPDEGEAGLFQRLAHRLGLRRDGWHVAAACEVIDLRRPTDKRPEQPDRIVQAQPSLGVLPRSLELEAVADDAGVLHQLLDLIIAQHRQTLRIEAKQHLAIALTFFQHRDPRQAGLKTFQQQEFEQPLRVAQRYAPFVIVIGDVEGIIVTPEAARHKAPRGGGGEESGILPGFPSQPKNR